MVSRPDRLNYTSWLNVMLLAEYHDRLERKDSENDDGPARLDLRNTSIVLNGKLFTDEKYQDMSTMAKLIYGYLIRPAQKRYKDEAGRVDEENDFLAKISQSCLINPKNVAAINLRKRTIVMLNGESLSFSRRFRHEMDKLVDEYNWKVEMSAKTAAPLGK